MYNPIIMSKHQEHLLQHNKISNKFWGWRGDEEEDTKVKKQK